MPGLWRNPISTTSRLTREGRARRRYNCGKQGEWDERAATAIELLTANRPAWENRARSSLAVADFGAGNERLWPLLQDAIGDGVEYNPYDMHPQLPTTIRLDVSEGLPDCEFDIAICLGLLEYLPSVPALAKALGRSCRLALVSYVTANSSVAISKDDRLRQGWATHLTKDEVEAAFGGGGFRLVDTRRSDGDATTLWLWTADGR